MDGQPVTGGGTSLNLTTASPTPIALTGIVNLTAGAHTVDVRDDCPLGTTGNAVTSNRYTWTVLLLGSAG